MDKRTEEKGVYLGFWVSVILKGGISVAEVIVGILVLFIPTHFLTDIMMMVVQSGVLGSADGFIAEHFLEIMNEFTHGTQIFISLYLLSRGVIKSLLIFALIKNKLWAYPLSLYVLGALVLYQLYQILTLHSFIVIAITIFDLIVMYFIWREYQIVKAHHGKREELAEVIGTE